MDPSDFELNEFDDLYELELQIKQQLLFSLIKKVIIKMNESIANMLDYVNENKTDLNIDQKVNYVYNKYDIGLSLMNQIREYFKQNTLQN